MTCLLQSRRDRRSAWLRFVTGAALYCLAFCGWSAPPSESPVSLIHLDGEVQAIKLETLAIQQQLADAGYPGQTEAPEQLLARDPAQLARRDYLAALGMLQRAEAQDVLTDRERLLLARLKLAYGLHLEAGFDLHAVAGDAVSGDEQNRAWYEMAAAYYGRGYYPAALEALEQIHGDPPPDILGEYQLLYANVLMSLGRNVAAAQVLSPWRGSDMLAAYGHYNLATALLRSGERAQAIAAFQDAIDSRVVSEEAAALRDKARLSLGYVLAQQGDYRPARRQLRAVREQGPFHNRALLALGWIAHKEGRPDAALESWGALQPGSPAEPAVLETMILVPAVHREGEDLELASRDYESALLAYESELEELGALRDQLSLDDTMARLLDGLEHPAGEQARILLGPILASRAMSAIRRDRSDLYAILEAIEQELRAVETVAGKSQFGWARLPQLDPGRPGNTVALPGTGESPAPGQGEADAIPGDATHSPGPRTHSLPEIDSPALRQVKPLPRSGAIARVPYRFKGLPQSAQWIKEPPDPEIFGMPDSEIIKLPSSGEFFRRPGAAELDDYAYPDDLPGALARSRSSDLLPAPAAASSFQPAPRPVGDALQDLAAALNAQASWRVAENELFDPMAVGAERERQIAALNRRIAALRERINLAFAQYENHARQLALMELARRQALLENLQEQASLELAKTYDYRSQQ